MLPTIISLLIYILILALVFYLVIWVLGIIGVTLPPKAVQILMAIFALIVILYLYQALVGGGGLHLGRI